MGAAIRTTHTHGSMSVAHREAVLTLIGAGVNDVERQVGMFGDTLVFGLFDCSGALGAGDINCIGTLHTFRLSRDFNQALTSYVQTNLLDNMVQPILDGSPTIHSNRIYALGTDSWVVQTPRNYTA